uniref:Tobamovirus multiplication protein 2A n=1 Tax=Triticum urartu TaxID=4572 RepID=A0A8R7P2M4_TRIUA
MAACRGFFECLLRLLNFFLTVAGLAMVGYGIYLLVEWMRISGGGGGAPPSPAPPAELLTFGRPMLTVVALGEGGSFFDKLPKACRGMQGNLDVIHGHPLSHRLHQARSSTSPLVCTCGCDGTSPGN